MQWNLVDLSGVKHIKKTDYLSPSSSQLSLAHKLGLGIYAHILSPCWDFSGLSVHGSCPGSHNLCEFLCTAAMLYPENFFLCNNPPPPTLTLFLLPLTPLCLNRGKDVCGIWYKFSDEHSCLAPTKPTNQKTKNISVFLLSVSPISLLVQVNWFLFWLNSFARTSLLLITF